ncbi:Receptor-like protein 43 [Linum grandiflorum]
MASSQLISPMKPYSLITWLISLFLLIPLLPILMGNVMVAGQCREDQRSLLLEFKHDLNLSQSIYSGIRLVGWNASTDCCQWPGISCDLGGLGRVVGLDLSQEWITGGGLDNSTPLFNTSIPAAIGNLTNLRYLNLSSAGFYGQIPAAISQLTNLVSLHLSAQNLQLENPNLAQLVHNLTHLTHLRLNFVDLSTQGHDWAHVLSSSLPNLTMLILRNCSLSAPLVHPSLSNLQSLTTLDLSYNNFSSPIPDFFLDFKNLTHLRMPHCGLIGTIPDKIVQNMTRLEYLDFSGNQLEGPIPRSILELPSLDLRGNMFSGNIPDTFQASCALQTLNLNNNRLRGALPESLENCTKLEVLDIGNNKISGPFPCLRGVKSSLRVLILRNNHFQGSIQCPYDDETTWQHLQIVDLAFNNFSGPLNAKDLDSWKGMMEDDKGTQDLIEFRNTRSFGYYQDSITVSNNGFGLELVKILTIFKSIDMSSNMLEGPIPADIGKFGTLRILNLSHNAFINEIPSAFGNLSSLEHLDLSQNMLTGHIPRELADLTFLSFLNLSNNHLVGSIPTGRQFDTFENTSYGSNPQLCGKPLTRSCTSPNVSDSESSVRHKKSINWDFLSKAFGYIFGLAAVMLPASLWPSFRVWYWPKIDSLILWMFPKLYVKDWNNRLRRTRKRRERRSRQ